MKDSAREDGPVWLLQGVRGEVGGPYPAGTSWAWPAGASQTSGKPQEELTGSGLCGLLCCSEGRPGRKRLLASFGQGRQWLGMGRGVEGAWQPRGYEKQTQTGQIQLGAGSGLCPSWTGFSPFLPAGKPSCPLAQRSLLLVVLLPRVLNRADLVPEPDRHRAGLRRCPHIVLCTVFRLLLLKTSPTRAKCSGKPRANGAGGG